MPTFDVRPSHYARAVAVAAAVAILGGFLWWGIGLVFLLTIPSTLPVLLGSLLAVPLGYAGGDLISRSVNRKRSNALAGISAGAVVVALIISLQIPGLLHLPAPFFSPFYGLLGAAAGIYLAVQRLRR